VRGRNFYHDGLGIALTAPQGWQIQNAAEAIAIVNGAGNAGLVVRVGAAEGRRTHDEVIRNVLKPVDGRTEQRSIIGLAATHFTGTTRTEQGQTRPVTLTLVTGPGDRNYWLQYAAKDAAARQRARPAERGRVVVPRDVRRPTAPRRSRGACRRCPIRAAASPSWRSRHPCPRPAPRRSSS
jgi:predicted Zn-dependent protease